jgi:hypothetical protein
MSFVEKFGIKSPTDDEMRQIQYILVSPAWRGCFRVYLERMRDSSMDILKDPDKGREDRLPDDFLRGQIATLEGFLKFTDDLMQDFTESMGRKPELTPEQEYDRLRAEGKIGPAGQYTEEDPEEL